MSLSDAVCFVCVCVCACVIGVEIATGKQTIENNALLWLRRFREARSMNQVIGRGSDFVHPYIEREEEALRHRRE